MKYKFTWKTGHWVLVFALGCIVEWFGTSIRTWAASKLQNHWFPPEKPKD